MPVRRRRHRAEEEVVSIDMVEEVRNRVQWRRRVAE
jgi:hypothetical protein